MSESKLKNIVLEYLSELDTVDPILNPKIDFGYKFIFPKGKDPKGNTIGLPISVVKPKNQDNLEISCGINIAQNHINAFNSMAEGSMQRFFKKLAKILLLHQVFFGFDLDNNRFNLVDIIYLNKGKTPTKNTFYPSIRKVFGCAKYSILELFDYCSGDFNIGDLELIK